MRDIHPEHIRKILIREVNWVGDAVLTLPALAALDRRFPEAEIVVVGRPWVTGLFRAQDDVDRVLVYQSTGLHRGPFGRWTLARQLRQEHFDLAVVFPNSWESAFLPWLARIPRRLGYPTEGRRLLLTHPVTPPSNSGERHQVFRYLALARALGGEAEPLPRLAVSPATTQEANRLLAEEGIEPRTAWIAVNPGSIYGSAKRWLAERFAAAADRLALRWQARVVLMGSLRETAVLAAVARAMREPAVMLGGRTDLAILPALLRRARFLLTNDTGAMHVAAAVGTPVLSVFGPTDATATGPLGPRSRYLRKSVPCQPCLLRECPIDHRCMAAVTVEEVVQAAEELVTHAVTADCPVAQFVSRTSGAVPANGAPAAFLDRDGTIIEDSGYLGDPAEIRFIPGAEEALRALRASGYRLMVVTNQAGVARGLITEENVRRVNQRLHDLLSEAGVPVDAIYYCPHHPDGELSEYRRVCASRKPGPGMIERAQRDFGLDLARSVIIGDHLTDAAVARHFPGMRAIMVLTGHGAGQYEKIQAGEAPQPDHVAADLQSAVTWLVHQAGR